MGMTCCTVLCMLGFFHLLGMASGNVVLIGKNVTRSFNDIEASFTPRIKGSGISGVLYLAEPLSACTQLANGAVEGPVSPFALIIRGECTFEDKIRNAQNAGFKAAIVYDDEDTGVLVASIGGKSRGISIYAVFVTKAAGEILKQFVGGKDLELWIIPSYQNSAWSIMALSFISLLTMSAILATCFFFRRHRIRQGRPRTHVREFHGMSSQLVKAMPTLIFTAVTEDNCTSATCAICLEDYSVGEKLRILPCGHKFHTGCVDSWLTTWRSFCPVCKRDANMNTGLPPPSEQTPLLSCPPTPQAPSSEQASFHSPVAASSPINIVNLSRSSSANPHRSLSSNLSHLPSTSLSRSPPIIPSLSSSPLISLSRSASSTTTNLLCSPSTSLSISPPTNIGQVRNSNRSFTNFPPINISRSRSDLRYSSSIRSYIPNLASPQRPMFRTSLRFNSEYMPPYIPRSNASPSCPNGSSGQRSHLRHCSNSITGLSGLGSTPSLSDC